MIIIENLKMHYLQWFCIEVNLLCTHFQGYHLKTTNFTAISSLTARSVFGSGASPKFSGLGPHGIKNGYCGTLHAVF